MTFTKVINCPSWFDPVVMTLPWRTLSDVEAPLNFGTWDPGFGLFLFQLALLLGLSPPTSVADTIDLLGLLGCGCGIKSNSSSLEFFLFQYDLCKELSRYCINNILYTSLWSLDPILVSKWWIPNKKQVLLATTMAIHLLDACLDTVLLVVW